MTVPEMVSVIEKGVKLEEKRWGPDCMAEFIFAGSYRLAQINNKITDVTFSVTNT